MIRLSFAIFVLFLSTLAHAKTLDICLRAVGAQGLEAQLATNDFILDRGLEDYASWLRGREIPALTELLERLAAGEIFLDAGVGAGRAAIEILERYPHVQVVGAAFKKPDSRSLEQGLRKFSARFRYVDGGVIEKLAADPRSPLFDLRGNVALLTDVFGPLAYTNDLPAVLDAYADLLKPGGQALLQFWELETVFHLNDSQGRATRPSLRELRALIPLVTGGRLRVNDARMRLMGVWPHFESSVLWLERVEGDGGAPQALFETVALGAGAPPKREIRVHLPPGFVFHRDLSRAEDMKREETRFQHAYVPDGFKFEP